MASCQELPPPETDGHDWQEGPGERWAPLGAVASPSSSTTTEELKSEIEIHGANEINSLRDEKEQMADDILALTSQFAQVQFRLKQIISGPEGEREQRLRELEVFADKGIPKMDEHYYKKFTENQKFMINELKTQLADLEQYAYENGLAEDIPTQTRIQKQEVVIQEMIKKLQVNDLQDLDVLSLEELRKVVDRAVAQIVNPGKIKDQELTQLRTQVGDLERFVDFLQGEIATKEKEIASKRSGRHSEKIEEYISSQYSNTQPKLRTQGTGSSEKSFVDNVPESATTRAKRILSVLHLFIISELGCASRSREKRNVMKEKSQEPHYGDLLAHVQMYTDTLISLAEQAKIEYDESVFTDCDYLSDEETYIAENKELTRCVRKDFAVALRELIEHGMVVRSSSRSLAPFGCFPRRPVTVNQDQPTHAWHVVLKYYEVKNGKEYNESPSRRLADSFGLEEVKSPSITVKQTLLSAIGHIVETHAPYKRSEDAHFKAFICLALNQKQLVPWLRQIFRTSALINQFYEPWSYVCRTNFEDVFCSMNKLKSYEFNLPVDLAVKQFSNIKDAF